MEEFKENYDRVLKGSHEKQYDDSCNKIVLQTINCHAYVFSWTHPIFCPEISPSSFQEFSFFFKCWYSYSVCEW